eukprot:Clim_evm20s3 gene=Clim_evmTU20s3
MVAPANGGSMFRCLIVLAAMVAMVNGFELWNYQMKRPMLSSSLNKRWNWDGDAIVAEDYVRLTHDLPSQSGSIWATHPLPYAAWRVTFEFKVHGNSRRLFGDGFAFWYTKQAGTEGPVFGNEDYFTGLGVFFDTYSNHQGAHSHGHPFVSAMVNDGSKSYDHDTEGTLTQLAFCEAKFRGVNMPTKARITYKEAELTIEMDVKGEDQWEVCFSAEHVNLPTNYFFGFTALTGELSDNHDILSLKVESLKNARSWINPFKGDKVPKALDEAPTRPRVSKRRRSWGDVVWNVLLFLLIAIVILGLVVAGAWFYKLKMKERANKRFY